MDTEQQVLSILLMRFNIKLFNGRAIAKEWLTQHPSATWETLLNLLRNKRVVVENGSLTDITKSNESNQPKTVRKYRGVEIQTSVSQQKQHNQPSPAKRQYRGVKY